MKRQACPGRGKLRTLSVVTVACESAIDSVMRDERGRFLPKNTIADGVPYSDEVAQQILDWLVEGKSLKSFCEQPGTPSRKCIYEWIYQHDEFAERYELARRLGKQSWADEMDDLAASDIDCGSMPRVQARKNQLSSRQWLMSRLYPDVYGDRVQVEHGGRMIHHLDAGHPDGFPHTRAVVLSGPNMTITLPDNRRSEPVLEAIDGQELEHEGEGDG